MLRPRDGVRLLPLCHMGQPALPQPKRVVGMAADLRIMITVEHRLVAVFRLAIEREPIGDVLRAAAEFSLIVCKAAQLQ